MTLVTQEDSDFTNIFRSSKNGFIQFAYSYLGNMQDAEDVVMESNIGRTRTKRHSKLPI